MDKTLARSEFPPTYCSHLTKITYEINYIKEYNKSTTYKPLMATETRGKKKMVRSAVDPTNSNFEAIVAKPNEV